MRCVRLASPRADHAAKRKLRRHVIRHDAAIQSRLPDTDIPHSRRYAGRVAGLPADGIVTADGLTLDAATNRIVQGDAVGVLQQLPSDWCACAITSPPYWHTVDYGVPGQIGLADYERYLSDLDAVWVGIERVLIRSENSSCRSCR